MTFNFFTLPIFPQPFTIEGTVLPSLSIHLPFFSPLSLVPLRSPPFSYKLWFFPPLSEIAHFELLSPCSYILRRDPCEEVLITSTPPPFPESTFALFSSPEQGLLPPPPLILPRPLLVPNSALTSLLWTSQSSILFPIAAFFPDNTSLFPPLSSSPPFLPLRESCFSRKGLHPCLCRHLFPPLDVQLWADPK